MSACFTDSGGPLQIYKWNSNVGSQMSVIGVTSAGSAACGLRNSYGVYTKVSIFLDWIEENVWPNKNRKIQSVQYSSSYPTMTERTGWVWGK